MARILVVDSDKSAQHNTQSILENQSHYVMVADGTDQAIQLLKNNHVDVVVSEIAYGQKDDFGKLHRQMAVEKFSAPIVLVSNGERGNMVDAYRGQNPPVAAFVEKGQLYFGGASKLQTAVEKALAVGQERAREDAHRSGMSRR